MYYNSRDTKNLLLQTSHGQFVTLIAGYVTSSQYFCCFIITKRRKRTLKGFKTALAPAFMTLKKTDTRQGKYINQFFIIRFLFCSKKQKLNKISYQKLASVSLSLSYTVVSRAFAHETLSPWWESVHISSYWELRSIHVSNPYKYICRGSTLVTYS